MIERINLVPHSYLARHEVSTRRVGTIVGIVALIFGLLGFYVFHEIKIKGIRKELALAGETEQRLNIEQVRLNGAKIKMEELLQNTSNLRRRVEIIDNLKSNRVLWSRVLARVSSLIPKDLWLSVLNTSDKPDVGPVARQVSMRGYAFSNAVLARFIADLERSGFFEETGLSYVRATQWKKREVYEFEITTVFAAG